MQPYTKDKTLLKVDHVSKAYGSKLILRDINLEIKDIIVPGRVQGQISSIVGVSGVGKSTLFSILAGLISKDGGSVDVFNEHGGLCPVKRGDMGVIFQNYWIYDWRKVSSIFNISVRKNTKIAAVDRKDFIEAIADQFGLMDHLDKYPGQLSGGQKQRVAIAEQLINGGNFILFDEPFSGLDALMIDKVLNILVKVANSDELKTLIIVSHDLANSVAISDSVFIIANEPGKEGAVIKREIDLLERGLAWRPEVKFLAEFSDTIKEIKSLL